MTDKPRILVIKLGALGDFMYAAGAMKAIRQHHKDAHITLLTRPPYADLARKTGFFDEILFDPKPKLNPREWFRFRQFLNNSYFEKVYDLQNNDRTNFYFKLFSPKPKWVGIAKGASHRNTDINRSKFHAFLGHQKTLRLANINTVALDPLDWLNGDIARFNLEKPYALIVPGSSEQHAEKRWPAALYRDLITELLILGIHPVILGSEVEEKLIQEIARDLAVTNLAGKTDIDDLPPLARGASIAIGNDTGPMHILSMAQCPVVMFFCSKKSTIQKHGPQSAVTQSFEADNLSEISVADVIEAVRKIKR